MVLRMARPISRKGTNNVSYRKRIPADVKRILDKLPKSFRSAGWGRDEIVIATGTADKRKADAELARIAAETPGFAGLKIETVPAGPKYTEVRRMLGNVFLAGGWAVPQLIEALDRGADIAIFDAVTPEEAIAEIAQPVAVFKNGRQTVRWHAPELLRH